MDLVCSCDRLFPLPVEEKAVSWTWRALAIGFFLLPVEEKGSMDPAETINIGAQIVFSLCLSRKRRLLGPAPVNARGL